MSDWGGRQVHESNWRGTSVLIKEEQRRRKPAIHGFVFTASHSGAYPSLGYGLAAGLVSAMSAGWRWILYCDIRSRISRVLDPCCRCYRSTDECEVGDPSKILTSNQRDGEESVKWQKEYSA